MATIDLRSAAERADGGSSKLYIGLTAAQAQAALGDVAATAAWYIIAFLAGGQLGPSRDTQQDRDEANVLLGDVVTRNEFIVGNASKQTSARTLKLLRWLEDNFVPSKYVLPLQGDADKDQLWYFERTSVDKEDWRMTTQAAQQRQRPFTLRASNEDGLDVSDPYVFDDVDLSDEANWPAELDGAKEAAFAGA